MQKISVVIITKDRADEVVKTIKRLRSNYRDIPIYIIDNGSRDGTVEKLRSVHNVTVVPLEQNLGAAARTIGVKKAGTSYVAFCDDDSYWEKGALEKAIALFDAYPSLGLINGKVIVHNKKIDPVCMTMAKSPLSPVSGLPGKPILGFVACGAIVRTKAFLDAGGFPDWFGVGGEEALLAVDMAKKGWELQYMPEIIVYHNPSSVRNAERRKEVQIRNMLWFTWLRRRLPSITAITTRVVKAAISERSARIGLEEAIRGVMWVIKNRQPVSRSLEKRLKMIGYA